MFFMCQVDVRNQKTNKSVVCRNAGQILYKTIHLDVERNQYYISLSRLVDGKIYPSALGKKTISDNSAPQKPDVELVYDEYYKVQIRLFQKDIYEHGKQPPRTYTWIQENLSKMSEWSEVLLIKPISNPAIYVNDWIENKE